MNKQRRRRQIVTLTARQVNLVLELSIVAALLSGLASWWLGDEWSGGAVLVHRVTGLVLLVVMPAKARGSVTTGLRRKRATRWLSLAFGILVLATIALGMLHATGAWNGVGEWSALWTHQLFAFLLLPLLAWHVVTRPVRPKLTDLNRRLALQSGLVAAIGGGLFITQEVFARVVGLDGKDRRFTGSHEVGSFDPANMPSTIWINDSTPADTGAEGWSLTIAGKRVSIDALRSQTQEVVATIDCTGGWYSEQSWDCVPLSAVLPEVEGKSVRVESATGYARLFAHHEMNDVYLAVGYNGEPLRGRHGAPVRLVAPGQRAPMWIKWVTSVEFDNTRPWLQPPLPLS
ncbi:MAG: molybdopterin-dependent oxidoreductase [Acidimicrobiia bacterium]|nr:molybdopterin-dependent oxidoreductase [Acidimicrobiia bacterium]